MAAVGARSPSAPIATASVTTVAGAPTAPPDAATVVEGAAAAGVCDAAGVFRNPIAHQYGYLDYSKSEAFEIIAFADLLLKMLGKEYDLRKRGRI